MKDGLAGKSIFRKDYEPYPWDVEATASFL